ncbi:MAG: hypothetical protein ACJAZO_000091 [Myxococcota bacterium]|jgi:hypothetical protein
MNIFLIPHTWARHIAVGLVVGGAGLLNWFVFLHWIVWAGPTLEQYGFLPTVGSEGTLFLATTTAAIAGASILAEHSLRRSPLWKRAILPLFAGALSFVIALLGIWVTTFVVRYIMTGSELRPMVSDPSLVSLRYRLITWMFCGVASAMGPLILRRFSGMGLHIFGGLAAGGLAGAVWHWLGYQVLGDMYLASAVACFTWGMVHGLFVWGIPSELYAGWVRVLSPERFAWRVPVDTLEGGPSERFVGHFPRGLDTFLSVENGVAELHTSFVVDREHHYAIRGLSQQPTMVKRMMESVDLRYDPRRPAPLETTLQNEDRIVMGAGGTQSEVEFLLLPKEER